MDTVPTESIQSKIKTPRHHACIDAHGVRTAQTVCRESIERHVAGRDPATNVDRRTGVVEIPLHPERERSAPEHICQAHIVQHVQLQRS